MQIILILGIIFLVLLIGIIIYIKSKVEQVSRKLFGTKSLVQGFQKVQDDYVSTPKSVSGMTKLFLPNIMKDFPDFHYEEMRERAEHILIAYLQSIQEHRSKLPDYANSDLKHQLELHLQNLENRNQREEFTAIKTHDCQLKNYTTEKGKCRITFQASVQYNHCVRDAERKVISGNDKIIEQSRYDIDVIYIQNRDLLEEVAEDAFGLNCPNCGAPITKLGQKYCEYCDTGIIEININVWSFSDVRES